MSKLWQKSSFGSAQDESVPLHPLIEAYTVGEDYLLDQVLLPYDIAASKVHAEGLHRINILTEQELVELLNTLDTLLEQYETVGVEILPEDEDCHTVIERFLVDELGDTGKKIHTGRSRNDQVLTALRLFMRDQLGATKQLALQLAELCLQKAEEYQQIPLPGYTHTQQAMLSSVGHYYAAILEALLDDVSFLISVEHHINRSPLGSAAGFGVSFPLDREFAAKKLGFRDVQINSLYCQNSRGKFEGVYLEGCLQIMQTLGRFAADMLFYTSQECDFFTAPEDLVTGSSIMPQKRNLDGLEILRGNVSVMQSYLMQVQSICNGLISGYHRDLQLIKKPLIVGTELLQQSLEVVQLYVDGLAPNAQQIEDRITKEIFMADIANQMVEEQGMPFREAYQNAADQLEDTDIDVRENLLSKVSPGAPGSLQLDVYRKRLETLQTLSEV